MVSVSPFNLGRTAYEAYRLLYREQLGAKLRPWDQLTVDERMIWHGVGIAVQGALQEADLRETPVVVP